MKKQLCLITLLAAALLVGNLFGAEKEKKVTDKTFKPARTVSIRVLSGDCLINKGGDGEIKVHIEYTYPADKYAPTFVETGDKLEMKEEFAKNAGNVEGESKWTITVPAKTNIEMTAASGDLTIDAISGDLNAHMASGDVKASALTGALSVNTASGDINFQNCSGAFHIKCASGDIAITGAAITGESSFTAVSGDLEISMAKSPAANMSISTVSGDTSLNYNGNPINGSFSFKSLNGEISSDVPFTSKKAENKHCAKTEKYYENGAAPVISIKTVSGSLKLKK